MKRCLLATLSLALVLALGACSSEPAVRVLFVGNSYTHYNDMPGMVRQLAASAGRNVEVAMQAPGGWWLRDHLRSSETLDTIATGDFDFVVLQEQSMAPADQRLAQGEIRPAVVGLTTRINQSGALPVLYMTWGHRGGSSEVGHRTYGSMQIAIAETYDELGITAAGEVAPVGAAWWISLLERPDIILYQADGSHPTAAGSYLAAAVITGTLLDVDPTEFTADAGLGEHETVALREFASRAVMGERPWESESAD